MKVEDDKDSIKAGVTEVIKQIYDANGEVKPTQLVEEARPVSSPAHRGFEWNNKRAAEQHRLWQARAWIRRVVIPTESAQDGEALIHVPKIVFREDAGEDAGPEIKEGSYKPVSVVVTRPDEFARALNEALAKMRAARRALDELYSASERTERADGAAAIAQMAKATEVFAEALSAMH